MAILKVARLGNPVLRKIADKIEVDKILSKEIQSLIDDMIETMRGNSGVGLAAPQVHQSIRLCVLESEKNPRYPEAPDVPLAILINPEFIYMSDEKNEGWESCLSIDDLRGLVARSNEVKVSAYNREGEKITLDASGFSATVLQHEIDNLNGTVYLDRMNDMKSLTHMKEYEKYSVTKQTTEFTTPGQAPG